MDGFNHNTDQEKQNLVDAGSSSISAADSKNSASGSTGSSVQTSDFAAALDQISLNDASTRSLNVGQTKKETSLSEDVSSNGDVLDPGAGNNTVTGSGDRDVILGTDGGSNTITTGSGGDSVVLGKNTVNTITDFNLLEDRLLFASDINLSDIIISQGANSDANAIDSSQNALIVDKSSGDILAALKDVNASSLADVENKQSFKQLDANALSTLDQLALNVKEGNGNLTGSGEQDQLVGGSEDNTLDSKSAGSNSGDEHDHTGAGASSDNHVALSNVDSARNLNVGNTKKETSLAEDLGGRGDLLDAGAGKNTIIGSGDRDVIIGNKGGSNTITTGAGGDTIVLGEETTNRILDFDPSQDRLVFDANVDLNNIVIGQGKNNGKGGVNQPLDSVNNTLVIDKSSGHILASLAFVDSASLNDFESKQSFKQLDVNTLDTLNQVNFNTTREGDGQLTGTKGRDKLTGGSGDNFLYVGNDGFEIGTATGTGDGEFPFPNDSPGTSQANATLKDGKLTFNGTYQNFDGAPLFSQGETAIDDNAVILNGSDPQALVDGFLKVQQDSEGNKISGTHLHFSTAGDSRGDFADATVVRYFENTPTDAKSGTFKGEFELTPEEQAAFLAGNLYINIHTNVDTDGDGKGGFPTGENRLNFNQNVVKLV